MAPDLTDQQRLDWLQPIRTPRVGPALFQDLINHFGSAATALDSLTQMAKRRGAAIVAFDRGEAAREMEAADKLGAVFVALGEAAYPAALVHVSRPPPLLCVLINDPTIAKRPCVGMVGSRNASAGGLSLARAMAKDLGEAGYAVASGLARGIDAAAHMGSLKTGSIAFVAGGLSQPYPPEHGNLMQEMAQQDGAVYSEMPLRWRARAQDFPKRNRLVAGASLGLVVVEAARRSGSLITARQAGEMGRLIMAVPGFPLDPRAEGPNSLLRDGATLVRDARDVMEELLPLKQGEHYSPGQANSQLSLLAEEDCDPQFSSGASDSQAGDDVDRILSTALSHNPTTADVLIEATGVPANAVRAWLLEHELAGQIERSHGDRYGWLQQP